MKLNNFLAALSIVLGMLIINTINTGLPPIQFVGFVFTATVAFWLGFEWFKDEKR